LSIYSAMIAGTSGLAAQSSALAAVSDNIANSNTIGYKTADTRFLTLVAGAAKTGSTNYTAGGVQAKTTTLAGRQGLFQISQSGTDMAVNGAGMFVVREKPTGSAMLYTRAGSFTPDASGYLRNTAGLFLQGWRLDSSGTAVKGTTVGDLEPVRVSDLNGTAEATSKIVLRANLNASTEVFAGAYAAGDMSSGAVTPQFEKSFDIYDAQGTAHRITLGMVKTGANEWQAEIHGENGETTGANDLIASGTIKFNADGSLDRAGSTAALFDPQSITWTNGAGAEPLTLDLGKDGAINGLTQFGSPSAMISATVNGGLLGNVTSTQVSEDGIVSAVFDNGAVRKIFQLPLATVENPEGLARAQGNAFTITPESGGVAINNPGAGGAGRIASNTLEASTVDIADQFAKMIVIQRAYGAASKIISTADEMLQELNSLKR
jgi:flagellar hook protein FlgE